MPSLRGSQIECELRMSEMGCEKGEAPRGDSDEGVGQKQKEKGGNTRI